MSASPVKRAAAETAPVIVPAMPASLEHLLTRVRASEAESAVVVTTRDARPTNQPVVVPTGELLRLVDALYVSFRHIADNCARASSSSSSAADNTARDAAQAEALTASLVTLEQTAAQLQAGIRSKLQQTARFAIIAHLRSEIASRERIVTRLQVVLDTAHRTMVPADPNPV